MAKAAKCIFFYLRTCSFRWSIEVGKIVKLVEVGEVD